MNLESISAQLPAFLAAFAAFATAFSLMLMIRRRRAVPVQDEEWRDTPPLIFQLFKPIVRLFTLEAGRLISEKTRTSLSNKLSAAGYSYAILPEEFVVLKFVCCVFGGITSVFVLRANPEAGPEIFVFVFTFAPVGFFYPDLWLSDQIAKRRRSVIREFPFLLDLLVLGMRAGLNYSGALSHAIGALPQGAVREEFSKVLREIRAGKPRREALLALGDRMNLEAINNFVAAINQAEETGGEIVDVLVAQAEQRRSERFNSAETLANKAPVRMLLPMMFFLFPIIFMLLAFIVIVKMSAIGILPDSLTALLRRQ
jgi:tight adherence protein C